MDTSLNSTAGAESVQTNEEDDQMGSAEPTADALELPSGGGGKSAGAADNVPAGADKSHAPDEEDEEDDDNNDSKAQDIQVDETAVTPSYNVAGNDASADDGNQESQRATGDNAKSGTDSVMHDDDDDESNSKAPDDDDDEEHSTALDDEEQSGSDKDGDNSIRKDEENDEASEEDLEDSDDDDDEEGEEEDRASKKPAAHEDQDSGSDEHSASGDHADGDDEESDEASENSGENDDTKGQNSDKTTTNSARLPKKKRERYPVPKIFQDAVTVLIPMDVTADLRIAVKHTREKRIQSIYKHFPALKKEVKKKGGDKSDSDAMTGDDEEQEGKDETKRAAKKKKLEHVPQPEQYGSVLDYLEAKYVKGVMLDEDEEEGGPNLDDRSEGQGSVYSKDSFLDDRDLQRDVAEQVMASTTLTKLELEHDDGDFFVNVGNLEIENDEYGENYDPLQDKDSSKPKKKRKKPPASSSATAASTSTPAKKKKTTPAKEEAPGSAKSAKSRKSTASAKSSATTKTTKTTKTAKSTTSKKTPTVPKSEKEKEEKAEKRRAIKRLKGRLDTVHKKGVNMIKELTDEVLPKRKTKLKVALTCPQKKKPGDEVTFSNPHNPGQKLKVKVPKDCAPGGTFKVSVPVKYSKEEEEKDHNTFSREFKDYLDDYAKAYDEWVQARHDSSPEAVNVYKEKQNRFEKLATEFPKNLMTKVDNAYLKVLLRKGRQSRYKRKPKTETEAKVKVEKSEETADDEEEKPQARIVDIPGMGKQFESVTWKESDFV